MGDGQIKACREYGLSGLGLLRLQPFQVAWGRHHGLFALSSLRASSQGSNSCPQREDESLRPTVHGTLNAWASLHPSRVPTQCQTVTVLRRELLRSSKANRNFWMHRMLPTISAMLLHPGNIHIPLNEGSLVGSGGRGPAQLYTKDGRCSMGYVDYSG